MRGALLGLAVGLHAVVQRAQVLGDRGEVDLVALLTQRPGEMPDALGGPQQRRLGVATSLVCDEPLEVGEQVRVDLGKRLAAAAGRTHPALLDRLARPNRARAPPPLPTSGADAR